MSLLFATGFGLTTSVGDLFESASSGSNTFIGAYGRNGGPGLRMQRQFGVPWAVKNLGVNTQTVLLGFAFKVVSVAGNGFGICSFEDAGTQQAAMTMDSDGTVHLTGTASTFNAPIGQYHYVEIKIVIGSSGSWVVKLNGTEVINVTGVDTQATANAYATQVLIGSNVDRSWTVDNDDIVIMDGTDGTTAQGAPFNDFLGDVRVDELLPTSAGDSTQWTPSAGSNFQCVDETPRDEDTTYVSSATVGQKDLYNYPSLGSPTGVVKGVIVVPRWRKDDAGTRTLKAKVKHSASEDDGPDRNVVTSYTYDYGAVFGKNPSTSAAWTIAEVNAAQAGIEVVA